MGAIRYRLVCREHGQEAIESAVRTFELLDPDFTVADLERAVCPPGRRMAVTVSGPQLLPVGQQPLKLSPSTPPEYSDTYYLLACGLFRLSWTYTKHSKCLPKATKLQPIAEFTELPGSPMLQVSAVSLPPRPQPPRSFQIRVQTDTGKTLPVEAHSWMTIGDLKMVMQDKGGIPPEQQLFIHSGRHLEDGLMMADYGIQEGALLVLRLRLRGGMFHPTSGRRGNAELGCDEPLTTQVTVVTAGHGELQLTVPADDTFTGDDLRELAIAQLVDQAHPEQASQPLTHKRQRLD